MKIRIMLCFLFVLYSADIAFADSKNEKNPVLISAYGTSYSETSFNAVSLLDPSAKGYWQPQSQDFGVNEGVYFQFKDPVFISFIEIVVEGDVKDKLILQPYLDGQTQTRKAEIATREVFSGMFKYKDGNSYYRSGVLKDEKNNYYDSGGDDREKITVALDEDGNEFELRSFEESYYVESYNIVVDDIRLENGNTVFTIKENNNKYLNYTAKSIFLKIKNARVVPKIQSIKIFSEDKNKPLSINIPLTPKASVAASSVLKPEIAYSPEKLFDSQLDMAWSTNGKETDGIGQNVTVTFDRKENIGGIIIWNGYQRSDAHYNANGRVKQLDVNGQNVQVKDEKTPQTILFSKPITSDKIVLTIKDIYKSNKYKDVLISELRFITPDGNIILPQVKSKSIELAKSDIVKTDVTYINLISQAGSGYDGPEPYFPSASIDTFRIRSNGSFVLYREGEYESADISEGNWQETGKNKIRIFGKKYRITPSLTSVYSYSGYSSTVDDPNVKPSDIIIFQSDITFLKYNSLTKKEQEKIVRFILGDILGSTGYLPDEIMIRAKTQKRFEMHTYFKYDDDMSTDEYNRRWNLAQEIMFDDLLTELEKINPVYVKSDTYTGLMIPYDEAR